MGISGPYTAPLHYIIILIASVNKKLQDRVSSLQKATISLSLSK
jgi:hypothetical protein